jgi:peroxidase
MQEINAVTSFLDLSFLYGADPATAAAVRTFTGGQLRAGSSNLLPRVSLSDASILNNVPSFFAVGSPGPARNKQIFFAADLRANQHPLLVVVHTMLMREHNRIAQKLVGTTVYGFDDEKIFQAAR